MRALLTLLFLAAAMMANTVQADINVGSSGTQKVGPQSPAPRSIVPRPSLPQPPPLSLPPHPRRVPPDAYIVPMPLGARGVNRYDPNSLANPYGAGSPYKADGLMNPYSQYGSRYSNKSWRNPYATDAPKLYDSDRNYRGRLSINRYAPDSISNRYGRYGNPYSLDSLKNPYGAGNPYSSRPIYVLPSDE